MDKPVSPQFNILGSTSVSGTTTITSSVSGTIYRDTMIYQINLSGNATGTININGSVDYSQGLPQGPQGSGQARAGNWFTMASVSVLNGSPTPIAFDLSPFGAPWTQCQFVSSTAAGVIDIWLAAKSYGS